MNGWMFFSAPDNRNPNSDFGVFWTAFPGMQQLSREEWRAYVPESRERLQGASLGFFCGGQTPSGSRKFSDGWPDFPIFPFVSDFVILPQCWTGQVQLTVEAAPSDEYRIFPFHAGSRVITVTGTLPDKPPVIRVWGSYCFFPPPYLYPGSSDLFL